MSGHVPSISMLFRGESNLLLHSLILNFHFIVYFLFNSTVIPIPHSSNIARNFIIPPPPTHRECIRELGEPVMTKAYQLLDKVDPEQAEVYHRGNPLFNCIMSYDLSLSHTLHTGGSFWTAWQRRCIFIHREAAAAQALRGLSL